MKQKFEKKPTTVGEQISLLKSRGMEIKDEEAARHQLSHINYYRLSAYWRHMEIDPKTHQFSEGSCFENALNLYSFDRELRLLLLGAIGQVEISVRTRWAYVLAHEGEMDAFSHADSRLAKQSTYHKRFLEELESQASKVEETFVDHFRDQGMRTLPIWAACEIVSLGVLSSLYSNLKFDRMREKIAKHYALDRDVLGSWLRHLVLVRNLCAHHSRLWNREFSIKPKAPSRPENIAVSFEKGRGMAYNSLSILIYLLDLISPNNSLRVSFLNLLEKYPCVDAKLMGFPDDWHSRPIWQVDRPR